MSGGCFSTLHVTYDSLKKAANLICRHASSISAYFNLLLELVAPRSHDPALMKAFFPSRDHVDAYLEDRQHGAVPARLCLCLGQTNRLAEECFALLVGGGMEGVAVVSKEALKRNLPHSPNSFLGNLLRWNMFDLEMLCVQQ